MLQAPAYANINGVTIYADDSLFYKFYPVAAAPRIRLDADGQPVFLLVKYALSDEDRLADPSLPPGGGYLNFDIQFDVPDTDLAQIRKQLQPAVDAQWQQLKNGTAQDKARPGVANTTEPPKIEFGTPTWTGGKVAMDAPQAKELVQARVSEAQPSLLSGNIAVFNMDLTPAGATFMQRTLVTPEGGIDLTPIQVSYDLKFWARLPAVKIHIQADSKKIHEYLRKVLDGRGHDYCTTYDFQHTDLTEDSIKMSGVIDVQIDTGSGSLPEEVISELRNYSLDLVKQMIQSSFFTSQPPAAPDSGEPSNLSDGSRNTKKYFKKLYNAAEMNINFNLEQRSVIEWLIHPQATLETFFKGMSPDQIQQHVREINLDDDFFKNLQLTVRAFTDFSDPAVADVEAQVRYAGTDENGQAQEKNKTFTFTSADPQKWSVSLIGHQREYQYRYRVGFTGQEAGEFSQWTTSKATELNVSIPNPGKIDLIVLVGDVDFDTLVQQVQVQVAYEDPAAGVLREEGVLLLSASHQEDRYQRTIFKPRSQPIQYKTRFRMKSGEVREDEAWRSTQGPQLLINQPFIDVLRVSLVPAGDGWDDIVAVSVELRYEDHQADYLAQDTLSLKSREEFKTWKISLRTRDLTDFSYRWLASYKNGHLEDSGWKTGSGSGTYPIVVRRQGFKILVLPDLLDFGASPITEVHLQYKGAGVDLQETFKFTDKTPQTWNIDVPQGADLQYTVAVTHFPATASPVELAPATERDTVVVIPAYRAPIPGKMTVTVFPTLVDFAVSQIVTLDLHYDDDAHNVHAAGALTFTDNQPQNWEITVKDLNQKQFTYKLSYFTADGVEHPQPVKAQDTPRIIIPRFKA
jgi:hypothetical protein